MPPKSLLNFFVCSIALSGVAQAYDRTEKEYYTVSSVITSKVEIGASGTEILKTIFEKKATLLDSEGRGLPTDHTLPDPEKKKGGIISTTKDLVALGEDIYNLVKKGKPTNTTSYAPISVLPRVGTGYADIFDTEDWKAPIKETFEVAYKNLLGMEVVRYRYSVMFSYGGTYCGKGAYITAAQIIPELVVTAFGYSFSATMRPGGIMNHGTKQDPVAGVVMIMEHTIETILRAGLVTDSFSINGRGGVKRL